MVDGVRGKHGLVYGSSSFQRIAKPEHPIRLRPLALMVAAAFGAVTGVAQANPSGPHVVSGQVTFTSHGNSLVVKNSPGAIINWQSFSIGQGQITDFVQQSVNSVVLNRVIGADPSVILGDLSSNGRIFLINPNGVVFGKGASVDAADLVVSSLNLTDADFQAGSLRFVGSASSGNISVAGVLRSTDGDVYLIAPNVTNTGSITAVNGNAILAAGQSVDILGPELNDIKFEVQNTGNTALNLGQITGNAVGVFAGTLTQAGGVSANAYTVSGGHVILSAVGDATLASGSTTRANTTSGSGGTITVVSQTGDLNLAQGANVLASGTQGGSVTLLADAGSNTVTGRIAATGTLALGGSIDVLGQSVNLPLGALLDASGARGGGQIVVGGMPGESFLLNAQVTTVSAGASLLANATQIGNGGAIDVYGATRLQMDGTVLANGGVAGGNGGSVDTSGEAVEINGAVEAGARAAGGHVGVWTIDPSSITIDNGGTTYPTLSSEISATSIVNALEGPTGTAVLISTAAVAGATPANSATITVAAPILANNITASSASLTLTAGGGITVESGAPITLSSTLATAPVMALNLYSTTGTIDTEAQLLVPRGSINISGPSFTNGVLSPGNSIIAEAINVTTATGFVNQGSLVVSAASQNSAAITDGGTITVVSGGNAEPGTMLANGNGTGNGGTISLTATGSIVQPGSSDIEASATGTGGSGGQITLVSPTMSGLTISANGISGVVGSPAGQGGTINLYATTGASTALTLTNLQVAALGGSGATSTAAGSTAGAGGTGGVINISGYQGDIRISGSSFNVTGGAGGEVTGDNSTGGIGGSGGQINLTASNGAVAIEGSSLQAAGGVGGFDGAAATGLGGAGGAGGNITLLGAGGDLNFSGLTADVSGGAGGLSANGGNAGTITVINLENAINLSASVLTATGGAGGTNGQQPFGAYSNTDGITTAGAGGAGGTIALSATNISTALGTQLAANGGDGGAGYNATGAQIAFAGGAGGNGGTISITNYYDPALNVLGAISLVDVQMGASGGAGGAGASLNTTGSVNVTAGAGGAGGDAGFITISTTAGTIALSATTTGLYSSLQTVGGAGGAGGSLSGLDPQAVGGAGGQGGLGGQIQLLQTQLSGTGTPVYPAITLSATDLVSAGGVGGAGGTNAFNQGGGGAGGAGGDSFSLQGQPGYAIVLSALGGIVADGTTQLISNGGAGGAGGEGQGLNVSVAIQAGSGGAGGNADAISISTTNGPIYFDGTLTLQGGNGGAGGTLDGTNITGGSALSAGAGGVGGSVLGPNTTALYISANGYNVILGNSVGPTISVLGGAGGAGGSEADNAATPGAGGMGGSISSLLIESESQGVIFGLANGQGSLTVTPGTGGNGGNASPNNLGLAGSPGAGGTFSGLNFSGVSGNIVINGALYVNSGLSGAGGSGGTGYIGASTSNEGPTNLNTNGGIEEGANGTIGTNNGGIPTDLTVYGSEVNLTGINNNVTYFRADAVSGDLNYTGAVTQVQDVEAYNGAISLTNNAGGSLYGANAYLIAGGAMNLTANNIDFENNSSLQAGGEMNLSANTITLNGSSTITAPGSSVNLNGGSVTISNQSSLSAAELYTNLTGSLVIDSSNISAGEIFLDAAGPILFNGPANLTGTNAFNAVSQTSIAVSGATLVGGYYLDLEAPSVTLANNGSTGTLTVGTAVDAGAELYFETDNLSVQSGFVMSSASPGGTLAINSESSGRTIDLTNDSYTSQGVINQSGNALVVGGELFAAINQSGSNFSTLAIGNDQENPVQLVSLNGTPNNLIHLPANMTLAISGSSITEDINTQLQVNYLQLTAPNVTLGDVTSSTNTPGSSVAIAASGSYGEPGTFTVSVVPGVALVTGLGGAQSLDGNGSINYYTNVTLNADSIVLNAPIILSSYPGLGSESLTLAPITAGTPITLGAIGSTGISLTGNELANYISLTGSFTIGSAAAGPISVSGPVNVAGIGGTASTLNLIGSSIDFSLGSSFSTQGALSLQALSGSVTDPSGNVMVFAKNINITAQQGIGASGEPLLVSTPTLGAQAQNGSAYITDAVSLTIDPTQSINVSGGDLVLTAPNITSTGFVSSSNDLTYIATSAITSYGISASGEVSLTAPIVINTNYLYGYSGVSVNAANFQNPGYLFSGGNTNLTGSAIVNISGSLQSTGDLTIAGGMLTFLPLPGTSASIISNNLNLSGTSLVIGSASPGYGSESVTADGTLNLSVSGNVSLLGGASSGAYASLISAGTGTYSIGGTLLLAGGSGSGSYALIDPSQGSQLTITAPTINLTGGSGDNAYAAIVAEGEVFLNAARSIALHNGSGSNADAVVVTHHSVINDNTPSCVNCQPTTGPFPLTDSTTEEGFYTVAAAPPPAPPAPTPAPPAPPPPAQPQVGVGDPAIDALIEGLLTLLDTPVQDTTPAPASVFIYVDGGADGCL